MITHSVKANNISLQKATLITEGSSKEITLLFTNNNVYIPIIDATAPLAIIVDWNSETKNIRLTYPDERSIIINTKAKQLHKESYWYDIDHLLYQGISYISADDLNIITERQKTWDLENRTLYIYKYATEKTGQSVISKLPFKGFSITDNSIIFQMDGLPEASWKMNGEISDFRLLKTTRQTDIEENRYAVFYSQEKNISNLLITHRILANGDQVIFTKTYSPYTEQTLKQELEQTENLYGSEQYRYIDKDKLHTLLSKESFKHQTETLINQGESIDQWYIFSKESLTVSDEIGKNAWETSLEFHQTNTWVTPDGTHRYTPLEYQEKEEYHNKNINLQASTPMLLIEALQHSDSRLIEDFIHNAKFSLFAMQGEDGFWRTELSAAYLNRAYKLGPNFIDTRFSVDASLFLVKYGLMFNDDEAVNKGKQFKNYFKMIDDQGLSYRYGEGRLYPDYYSEKQSGKTFVSLNHSLHELNYLYSLYNWIGDKEAKVIADKILIFIKNSYKSWIKNNNDLYYALSPWGQYYATDYENITYVDLFTLQSILNYMNVESSEIDRLLNSKHTFLTDKEMNLFESNLNPERLFTDFDTQQPKKGNIWLSYPPDITWSDSFPVAYLSYGAYHWIKGASEIIFLGERKTLNPEQKYMVIITKERLDLVPGTYQ